MNDYDPSRDVAQGMGLLDQHSPGWRDKIDRDTLDMSDNDRCVLGQVYGSYGAGLVTLGPPTSVGDFDAYFGFEVPRHLGSDEFPGAPENAPYYAKLTDTWKKVLATTGGQP